MIEYELLDSSSPVLQQAYDQVMDELRHISITRWEMEFGIIASHQGDTVGGIFFSTSKYPKALLINAAWVKPEFRRQGIYTELHQMINKVAAQQGKTHVYTYIHEENELMKKTVAEKIGYGPVMTLYQRRVPA